MRTIRNSDTHDSPSAPQAANSANSYLLYLKDIQAIPLLTQSETLRLANLARNGSPEDQLTAKQTLLQSNLRLVIHFAESYRHHPSIPIEDFISEGNIGLREAIEQYNPALNVKLSTYVAYFIKSAFYRLINQSALIPIPKTAQFHLKKLIGFKRDFQNTHGYLPSQTEIATHLNLSLQQIQSLDSLQNNLQNLSPLSFDAISHTDPSIPALSEPIDPSTHSDPYESTATADATNFLLDSLRTHLSPQQFDVITQRYGLIDHQNPVTLQEIANAYGISKERIRQIESEALLKLRKRLSSLPFLKTSELAS